ncbi:lipopolysaccharide assembly protein LapB [Spongorhabdus nitratireducens]
MSEPALLLLIICAMLAGYFLGRRDNRRKPEGQATYGTEYFTGLNYLLNEQTDEAIESFIKALDLNADAFDTHLALGRLFCKRGEIEKAIRVYQDLLARPSLQTYQSAQVQLELARAYQSAGLLDRAEALLNELTKSSDDARSSALAQLLDIYQIEKEWSKALKVAETLRKLKGDAHFDHLIAHFYCELAEKSVRDNDYAQARRLLRHAASRDKNSVRASMIMGQLEYNQRNYKAAISALQRVLAQDARFVPATLGLIEQACQKAGDIRSYHNYLSRSLAANASPVLVRAMYLLMKQTGDHDAARAFLIEHLKQKPSLTLLGLLVGRMQHESGNRAVATGTDFELLADLMNRLVGEGVSYSCRECGYDGRMLHWQCPSCKSWGTVSPN